MRIRSTKPISKRGPAYEGIGDGLTTLGQRWAGRAFGTNTGNIYAEFRTDAGNTTGTLRFMDSELGLSRFAVVGTFDGNGLQLTGNPIAAGEGVELGTLTIRGNLHPDGQIRGNWESTLGTAGTFVLHPHDISQPVATNAPEQLHTAVRTVGALRLYSADVKELIGAIGRDLNHPEWL